MTKVASGDIRASLNAHALLAALLYAWTFLLRLPTFLRSEIDWDESLYLIMAEQWAQGHAPFTTVWDHLPVGIYLLFRMGLACLGASVVTIRLLAVLAVFFSAVLLYLVARRLLRSVPAAIAAAFAYPVFSLGLGGLAANTELFFICFMLAGLLCIPTISPRPSPFRFVLAGLLMGIAFQIKYLVLIEVALFFFWARLAGGRGREKRGFLAEFLMFGLGFLLPSLAVIGYYARQGLLMEFYVSNIAATFRHIQPETETVALAFAESMAAWFRWIWPLAVFALPALFMAASGLDQEAEHRRRVFLVLWLGAALMESWVTRNFYGHYYLVTLPPLCCLFGLGLSRMGQGLGLHASGGILLLFLPILLPPMAGVWKGDYRSWFNEQYSFGKDLSALAADYIEQGLAGKEAIYVVNSRPIIYFLSKAGLPSPYVFPPFLVWPHFSGVAGVEYRREVERILAQRPRFIVIEREDRPRVQEIEKAIRADYALEAILGEDLGLRIYRAKSSKSSRQRDRKVSSSSPSQPRLAMRE